MLVDLHIHTYYSDGTMSPKEVVEDAKRKNLGIIAITDHDVLDSYEELKVEAEKAGIIAIRGVEIDSIFEGHLASCTVLQTSPTLGKANFSCPQSYFP